jgi:dolichol-phosphate mannosyltransferase
MAASAVVRNHAQRPARFGAVGASGVAVNSAVFWMLVSRAHLSPVLAGAVATEAAIVSNFLLNDRWTFRDRDRGRRWLHRAWRYNAIALGGLVVSVATLAALTHMRSLEYQVANLVAIGTATIWNYTVNSRFTWAGAVP